MKRFMGTSIVAWGQGLPLVKPVPLESVSKCIKYKIPTVYRLLAFDQPSGFRFPFLPARSLFPFQLISGPLASHSLMFLDGQYHVSYSLSNSLLL